jgi:hypothetical protein
MSLSATTLRLWGLSLALAALPGCGGKLIRLGDDLAEGGRAGGGAGNDTASAGAAAARAGGGGVATTGGGGATAGGPGGGTAASGGADSCAHGEVLANEVLWIGDSWVQGTPQTVVSALAGVEYPSLAAPGASMAAVAKQYDTRENGITKVKVLLMDGGTIDPLLAKMAMASVTDAVTTSLHTFQDFLTKVATDGTVEHIVYVLVPPLPAIPGVDMMRGDLSELCAASVVQCHFLDLQPLWMDPMDPTLTAANGILPTEKGGAVIGDAIWDVMQKQCIAQ